VPKKFPIVLVVDDSKAFRVFCKDVIKRSTRWVRVYVANDGIDGLQAYLQYKPDLVLLDMNMPRLDGTSVLKAIMKDDINARVIVTSAYTDDQDIINHLIKLGAYSFVPKPMNRVTLSKTISEALYSGKVVGTNNQISKSFVLNQNYN